MASESMNKRTNNKQRIVQAHIHINKYADKIEINKYSCTLLDQLAWVHIYTNSVRHIYVMICYFLMRCYCSNWLISVIFNGYFLQLAITNYIRCDMEEHLWIYQY